MKILHVFNSLKFSGAEIMYVDAAPFFQAKGCQLTAMATNNDLGEFAPYFERAGYKVLHQQIPTLKNYFQRIKYYRSIVRLLKKDQYDVVHIHSSAARWGFALCAWIANTKSVYTFHAVFPTRAISYPYHLIIRWSAKSIFKCKFQTISDTVYDHELKVYKNKTIKVYNWFGNTRFYPSEEGEKSLIRQKLEINNNTLVLISIGGCNHNKRHSDIIKALPYIIIKNPDTLYLHLGKGCTETEEYQLASSLGVSNNVRFCRNQEDVRKFLIASDIYLMTSQFEGISITTIEAMACNIPTILYDVPGLRDFNKHGNNSVLIPEDYKLLADSVLRLCSNKKESIEMVENAQNSVNLLYNLQNNASKIYNLYL